MLGWIYRMIVGHFSRCQHKWKIHEEHALVHRKEDDTVKTIGTLTVLQCQNCGDLKEFKTVII